MHLFIDISYLQVNVTVAWPSGLRRWFKAPVSSEAWVRIPPLPNAFIGPPFYCVCLMLKGYISNTSIIIPNCVSFQSWCKYMTSNWNDAEHKYKHNVQNKHELRQKSLAAVGFEPTPPKRLVPKTSALDRSATLPGQISYWISLDTSNAFKNQYGFQLCRLLPRCWTYID